MNDSLAQPHGYVEALRGVLAQLDTDAVEAASEALMQAREAGRTVFIVGNGGSASTASHMATDLCKVTAVGAEPGVRAWTPAAVSQEGRNREARTCSRVAPHDGRRAPRRGTRYWCDI